MIAALSTPFSLAGSDDSSKGGIVTVPPAAECSTREFQPIFTRYARTSTDWTLKVGYRSFTDMHLQEARDFDATVMDVELTIPFTDRLQVRIYYPFRTEGDAYHFEDGGAFVDVEGNGGVEDWPSIFFDYQFKKSSGPGDSNMTAYFGFNHSLRPLDVTVNTTDSNVTKGDHFERYNHRGTGLEFGVRMDKQLNNCWSFVGNAGLKYIWESDDINPSTGSDAFWHLELGAGIFYAPSNAWIIPGVELLFETQLTPETYTALTIVPEVIVPLGDHVDLSAGIGIGILDDGPATDARISLTARF